MPEQPSSQRRRAPVPAEIGTAAIRFLAQHGFEATTAGDLADAVGMSRSTFFRRFGSKDDVIFADHDLALGRLEEFLSETELPVEEALARATVDVLHLLTRDVEAAQLRSGLLRRTPALRERELVITHRYERVYAAYLARVSAPDTPPWVPIALASAMVAVHNAALRRWLRDPDPRAAGLLDAELRTLVSRFSPWFGGVEFGGVELGGVELGGVERSGAERSDADRGATRIVVAAFDAGASPDEVLRAVGERLR